MRGKLLKISQWIILWMSLVIYTFFSIVSFFSTAYFDSSYLETTYYKKDSILFHLCSLLFFLALLYGAEKKKLLERISSKKLCFILLCYAAVFSGVWSVVSHSVPTADQFKVADGAADFIRGDYYYLNPGKYLQLFPRQLGYVAFLEVMFRIFGSFSYSAVEIVNVGFICLEFYMIYKITDLVFEKKKIVNLVLLLLFFCLPYLFFSTFIYGDIPGSALAMTGIYLFILYIKKHKISYGILAALCLGAAVTLKQNNLIPVIAIVLYLLLKGLEQKKYSCLLMIGLCFLSITAIGKGIEKQYEIRSGYEVGDGLSILMYVAMGMQEGDMAEGWYNGYILGSFWDCNEDIELSTQKAKQDIQESINHFLSNPSYALKFYYKKIVSQWNNPTYECLWISHFENSHDAPLSPVVQSLYDGKLHQIFLCFVNEYQWILFLGACIGMYLGRKEYTLEQLILALIVIGGFFFHILCEAKGRYVLFYFILMIPYAAVGYERILNCFQRNSEKHIKVGELL